MSEQSMVALHRANEVRHARALWKRDVAALPRVDGQAEIAEVLRQKAYGLESEALELAKTVPVAVLIGWIRRRTEGYAYQLGRQLGLHRVAEHEVLVKNLTVREALALADALHPITVNQEA